MDEKLLRDALHVNEEWKAFTQLIHCRLAHQEVLSEALSAEEDRLKKEQRDEINEIRLLILGLCRDFPQCQDPRVHQHVQEVSRYYEKRGLL